MTNSLFILEKETRSKIIKPLPGIKTKKKNLSFLWSHTLTSYWKHCQSALIKDNQYFQNDRKIDLMSKTLPFHLPHMYVYILVVNIPSKTFFSYTQYHWLFGEVFLSTSKSKWFLNFNMHGVCSVVCGMFTAFNKIWIF